MEVKNCIISVVIATSPLSTQLKRLQASIVAPLEGRSAGLAELATRSYHRATSLAASKIETRVTNPIEAEEGLNLHQS